MPWAGGTTRKSSKACLCPFQERVAFTVAFVFHGYVQGEGRSTSEGIDLDGMIDDQVGRHDGIDRERVASHPLGG